MNGTIVSLVSLIGLIAVPSANLKAETPQSSQSTVSHECSKYRSGRDFVARSTMRCLRSANQRSCHNEAAERFAECKFSGSYEKLTQALNAKMLVVIALAGSLPTGDKAAGAL